jgi:hypothetical protein
LIKAQKYSALDYTHHFVAIAVETLGSWNTEGLDFLIELGRRTTQITGNTREANFIFQRISVAVQLGNAVSFAGSLPATSDTDQDLLYPDI